MPLILVQSIDDPRLACYRQLNERNLTRQSGLFIAEGEKVVERLIGSPFEVASILAEPAYAMRYAVRLPSATPVYVATQELLEATIGFNFHRGVVACGRRRAGMGVAELLSSLFVGNDGVKERMSEGRAATGIVTPSLLHSFSPSPSNSRPATLVICPEVHDPTNLGGIIRTAAAFGCCGVVLGEQCADPFSRRVLRVSMGAALQVPIALSRDLPADLAPIAATGFELLATVVGDAGAEPLAAGRRSARTAVLFGSEGHGLSAECLAQCHRRVTIPMQLGVDSLNVAVAAAVVLYELAK
jgi:tRNA G18 (ribose-2'-O)-methylase SpoU